VIIACLLRRDERTKVFSTTTMVAYACPVFDYIKALLPIRLSTVLLFSSAYAPLARTIVKLLSMIQKGSWMLSKMVLRKFSDFAIGLFSLFSFRNFFLENFISCFHDLLMALKALASSPNSFCPCKNMVCPRFPSATRRVPAQGLLLDV